MSPAPFGNLIHIVLLRACPYSDCAPEHVLLLLAYVLCGADQSLLVCRNLAQQKMQELEASRATIAEQEAAMKPLR